MMSNPFLYPGRGKLLRKVSGATGNSVSDPEVTAIPDGSYSEIVNAQEGLDMCFEFVFGAAATGSVVIQKVPDPAAAGTADTFDTVTLTAAHSANWSAGEPLIGPFRLLNSSGQTLTAYYNNKIR